MVDDPSRRCHTPSLECLYISTLTGGGTVVRRSCFRRVVSTAPVWSWLVAARHPGAGAAAWSPEPCRGVSTEAEAAPSCGGRGCIARLCETPRQKRLPRCVVSYAACSATGPHRLSCLAATPSARSAAPSASQHERAPLINLKGIVNPNADTANPLDSHSTASRPDAPAGSGDDPQTSHRGAVGRCTTRRRWRR